MSDERPSEKCPVCGALHELPKLITHGAIKYYPKIWCPCGALLELESDVNGETASGFIFETSNTSNRRARKNRSKLRAGFCRRFSLESYASD